jgi:hypothetical protein
MKLIPLTQGQFSQVDDADYEWLSQYSWHAYWDKCAKSYYARRTEYLGKVNGKGKFKTTSMHRQILGLTHGDTRKGDHKEPSETLNNQRSNLRIANTDSDSSANRHKHANNTTGYKGVQKHGKRYRVFISTKYLGTRDTPEEGHALYAQAAQAQFGEFACLA